mgnify:CR=1 FL=1
MARILLAEDDDDMRRFLVKALERAGYDVSDFDNGASAYERLREEPFSLLLTDIVMPEMDGIELARRATEIDPLSVLYTVLLLLVLPMILGMLLNAQRPAIAAKLRRPLQIVSMVIFIAFIVAALAANWNFFLGYVGHVAVLVLLHNGLALAAGFALATLAGLGTADRRAITIETGIQNSGLGLILIFVFFGGLGGMTVAAAFWGIWHAVSGLALASLWARRPVQPA